MPQQTIYLSTNALNKIQFITNIKLLLVSAPGSNPQGVIKQRNIRPTHQSRYYTAQTLILKF